MIAGSFFLLLLKKTKYIYVQRIHKLLRMLQKMFRKRFFFLYIKRSLKMTSYKSLVLSRLTVLIVAGYVRSRTASRRTVDHFEQSHRDVLVVLYGLGHHPPHCAESGQEQSQSDVLKHQADFSPLWCTPTICHLWSLFFFYLPSVKVFFLFHFPNYSRVTFWLKEFKRIIFPKQNWCAFHQW